MDNVFKRMYENDVCKAYCKMGTKLRSTVHNKSGVVGKSTTFQKMGRGPAATKSRHGLVPVMNLIHHPVECFLQDYYAGDWIDNMGDLRFDADERKVVAQSGAFALGKKTDQLIVDALSRCDLRIGDYKTGLTKDLVVSAIEHLNEENVNDDGDRYAIVGVRQWNNLLNIPEFVNSMVSDSSNVVCWLGVNWLLYNGLPRNGNKRDCFMYHRSAVGHASGPNVDVDITWHGERAAHFVCHSMAQGAELIDTSGVVCLECKE